MAAHALRSRLRLGLPAALLCLAAAFPLPMPVAIAALGYAALTLALRAPALPLGADLSYGLYIYGWPVAQTLVHLHPGLAPVELAALSLACTLPLAAASWHFVERPALRPTRAMA
jgi:peptidoglycan/LPS O-acetylase OafA/YrhL